MNLQDDELTRQIIGAAIEVHKALGPGLLESAYQKCLTYELNLLDLEVRSEVSLPLIYKEIEIDYGYRIDLLVNDSVVIELKTVEAITDVHIAQTLTYLRLGNYSRGLVINFNVKQLIKGIKRVSL